MLACAGVEFDFKKTTISLISIKFYNRIITDNNSNPTTRQYPLSWLRRRLLWYCDLGLTFTRVFFFGDHWTTELNSCLLRQTCGPSTPTTLYLGSEMKAPFTVILRIGHSVQKRKTTQQDFPL